MNELCHHISLELINSIDFWCIVKLITDQKKVEKHKALKTNNFQISLGEITSRFAIAMNRKMNEQKN